MMLRQRHWRRGPLFGAACLGIGLAFLLGQTGCTEPKSKSVAQTASPATASQPPVPAASGASGGAPDPHPWIGTKPPPGSALPTGGPKIPQK